MNKRQMKKHMIVDYYDISRKYGLSKWLYFSKTYFRKHRKINWRTERQLYKENPKVYAMEHNLLKYPVLFMEV